MQIREFARIARNYAVLLSEFVRKARHDKGLTGPATREAASRAQSISDAQLKDGAEIRFGYITGFFRDAAANPSSRCASTIQIDSGVGSQKSSGSPS